MKALSINGPQKENHMTQVFFKQRSTLVALAAAAFMVACGGGGGGTSSGGGGGSTGTCTAAPCIGFATLDAGWAGFGGLENGFEIANDPANASNQVLKLTKETGDQSWAGVTLVNLSSAAGAANAGATQKPALAAATRNVINPSTGITLRVYSPSVGLPLMVKIETDNPDVFVEASVNSTKANEWETLTFNYPTASATAEYTKISVFPAHGQSVSSTTVTYLDELKYSTKTTTPVDPTTGLTILNFDEATPATLDAFEGTSFEASLDGTNKIAKLTKPTTAQAWGGATFKSCPAGTVGATPSIPFTSSLQTISIRVKAPRAGVTFSLEAKNANDESTLVFAQATNTGTDWETLTFNFANKTFGTTIDPSKAYNKLSIFPNFNKAQEQSASPETTNSVYYFDDVKLVGSTATLAACPAVPVVAVPTTAPAAPTANAADVLSVYSDAYTAIAGVNTNPNWSQNTVVTNETYASNAVLKMANLNYQGISWENNPIDVSAHSHLHIDMWSETATSVNVFIIGGNGGGESSVTVPLTAGAWTSTDIPLSSYTTPASKSNIIQLKLVATTNGNTLYVDNIYFKRNAATGSKR
jgi:hypothetical protein